MAELFDTTKQNISLHIKNIFDEKELNENSIVKFFLTTAKMVSPYLTVAEISTLNIKVHFFILMQLILLKSRVVYKFYYTDFITGDLILLRIADFI